MFSERLREKGNIKLPESDLRLAHPRDVLDFLGPPQLWREAKAQMITCAVKPLLYLPRALDTQSISLAPSSRN